MSVIKPKINNNSSRVAVIVPSYNGVNDLRLCLARLVASNYKILTIIVIDNASDDGTSVLMEKEYPDITFIKQKINTGFTGACLRGWQEALKQQPEYVALINQDLFVDAGWLGPLVNYLKENSKTVAVQPLILLEQDHTRIHSAGTKIHFLGFGYADQSNRALGDSRAQPYLREPREITYASGAAVLLRVKDIKELGLFPEDFFMYHEDLDLGWRIRLAGKNSVLVPASRAYHRYEFYRSTRIKYEYGERNRLIVLLQNYRLLTLLLIFPAWIVMEIGIIAFSIFRGWFPLKIKGYLYVVINLDKILKERRRLQKSRAVGDKAVIKNFEGEILYQEGPSYALKIVNPFLRVYWSAVRYLIWW